MEGKRPDATVEVLLIQREPGPFFYKDDQSPAYPLGIWSMIASHLIEIAVILLLRYLLSHENQKRDAMAARNEDNKVNDLDSTAFLDLTASTPSNPFVDI